MKQSQLPHVYEEWIRSVESGETNKTFCAVEVDTWEECLDVKRKCRIVGFGMDKTMCEVFQGTYGLLRDTGRLITTHILDLSKKLDKRLYNDYFKDGKVLFGNWEKLRRFHY